MVTRGLFPRLGLDHYAGSELAEPRAERRFGSRCSAGILHALHFMAHTVAGTFLSHIHTGHENTRKER